MKKYFKHFLWLYIVLAVLLVLFILSLAKGGGEDAYTRQNTGCLTEERVFDYADKLSDAQEESLRELIAETEDEIGCDIVLMTIEEDVPDLMAYADDFYDNNRFGYNRECGDGAIYVDNWATGDVWFSTCGKVEDAYSVSMIDRLIERVCEDVNEDPYGAYQTYVRQLKSDMSGHGGGLDISPGYGVLFALIVTIIYLVVNLVQSKGKKTTTASTYVAGGKPFLKRKEDIFLNKHVTKRHIDTSGGSGGGGGHHISSGGVSHGGGGGHH